MKEFSKKQLLINYLLGICTIGEKNAVEAWLKEHESNVWMLQDIAGELGQETHLTAKDKEQIINNIFDISSKSSSITNPKSFVAGIDTLARYELRHSKSSSFYKIDFWAKIAAVFLVFVLASIGAYYYLNSEPHKLTSEWKIKTLPFGQTATLKFGEGSVIKLNGGSTLRYPTQFSDTTRMVYLKGEAFFSVAHNDNWPFTVHVGNVTTHVLGTSFNINAYKRSKEIEVVVAEGRVMVTRADSVRKDSFPKAKPIILEKNQWVTIRYDKTDVQLSKGDIWEKIAWKDDILVFDSEPFSEVAGKLERWYGIKIIIQDKALANKIVKGAYDDVNLNHVLESIQFILGAQYSMKGNIITFQLPQIM